VRSLCEVVQFAQYASTVGVEKWYVHINMHMPRLNVTRTGSITTSSSNTTSNANRIVHSTDRSSPSFATHSMWVVGEVCTRAHLCADGTRTRTSVHDEDKDADKDGVLPR